MTITVRSTTESSRDTLTLYLLKQQTIPDTANKDTSEQSLVFFVVVVVVVVVLVLCWC